MDNKVKEQILAIRKTGLTNMFDTLAVQRIAMKRTSSNWWFSSRSIRTNTPVLSSQAKRNGCKLHNSVGCICPKDCAEYARIDRVIAWISCAFRVNM